MNALETLVSEDLVGFNYHLGTDYITCLSKIHHEIRPKVYFEIGTANGNTLALASRMSISVDPSYEVSKNVIGSKETMILFQQTSDNFFLVKHNILSESVKPDLSFLDGMHLFEYLLRDFINTEKFGTNNSVILMHDCLPLDNFMTSRDAGDLDTRNQSVEPTWWTGDVWKVVAILKKYRDDLQIEMFDAPPTGLVAIKNLSPKSTRLSDRYSSIVAEYLNAASNADQFGSFVSSSVVLSTDGLIGFLSGV